MDTGGPRHTKPQVNRLGRIPLDPVDVTSSLTGHSELIVRTTPYKEIHRAIGCSFWISPRTQVVYREKMDQVFLLELPVRENGEDTDSAMVQRPFLLASERPIVVTNVSPPDWTV